MYFLYSFGPTSALPNTSSSDESPMLMEPHQDTGKLIDPYFEKAKRLLKDWPQIGLKTDTFSYTRVD